MSEDVSRSADHTFAICAYGQSPYLEECIASVLEQTRMGSEVYISTSTPSDWLDGVAGEYGLPVFVNTGDKGIGQDWNAAYSHATRSYVTIAHQDDIYDDDYVASALEMLEHSAHPLVFFCDYGEIRSGLPVVDTRLLRVKRRMLAPLRDGHHAGSVFLRRRILSLGSPICCPSVTFSRRSFLEPPFRTAMQCSLDWDTWENISKLEGDFLYSSKIGMYHRIHNESATTALIENDVRGTEDFEMYRRFWPGPIADLLSRRYSRSQKSNALT